MSSDDLAVAGGGTGTLPRRAVRGRRRTDVEYAYTVTAPKPTSGPTVSTVTTVTAVTAASVTAGDVADAAGAERGGSAAARRVVKRVLDVTAATLALLVLAPLLLLVGVAIRSTSRGPALFRQTRVGRDGREFTMVKFRSMCVDAESRLQQYVGVDDGNGVLFKLRDDPRVTRVGRLLRRTSLDELPQLVHVVTGSMSLVGPRPPLPNEVATYDGQAHRRLSVRPGLTGLWQVSGRSNLSWEESISLDLRYVEDWSLSLDFVVLCKTAGAVLRADGAY